MTVILPVITLMLFFASLLIGIYIQNYGKDLSKNSGFMFTDKKSMAPFLHVLFGFLMGLLIFPAKYSWEDKNTPYEMNKKIWSRQIIGLVIYIIFTGRNMYKHPRNLRKKLIKCKMKNLYSFFASSVTRQQAQLIMGVSIGILFSHFVVNKGKSFYKVKSKPSIIFLLIINMTIIQYILQIGMTLNNDMESKKYDYLKCVNSFIK
jgi:hypothetical protein